MRLILILQSVLFVGCTPFLVPHDFDTNLVNNQAVVEVDSVTFVFEHLESNATFHIFNLEVINNRDTSVYVDIRDIHFLSSASPMKDTLELYTITRVMSPKAINNHYKSNAEAAVLATGLLFAAGAALVIIDATKDQDDNKRSEWNEEAVKASQRRDALTFAGLKTIELTSNLVMLSREATYADLAYLPAELFLADEIYPGESYLGKVFILKGLYTTGNYKYPLTLDHFRIRFPFERKVLNFDFRNSKSSERYAIRESRRVY